MQYKRLSFPSYHIAKGIAVIAVFLYMLCSRWFNIWHYEDNYYLAYLLPLLDILFAIDGFRRIALSFEFNDNACVLYVTYISLFFVINRREVRYENLCYLSYNIFKPIIKGKISEGVTEIRIYNDRQYVCAVKVSNTGWPATLIDALDEKIAHCAAKKYKISPGIL